MAEEEEKGGRRKCWKKYVLGQILSSNDARRNARWERWYVWLMHSRIAKVCSTSAKILFAESLLARVYIPVRYFKTKKILFVVFQAFISFRTSKTVFNLAYKQVILSEEDINIFGRSLDNWQRHFFKYSWKLCYSSRAYSLQTYNCRLTVCLPWLDTVVTIHTIA